MGQGQGKASYSQIGEDGEPDSPDGPDLPPPPDSFIHKASQQLDQLKTQAEHAVLRFEHCAAY